MKVIFCIGYFQKKKILIYKVRNLVLNNSWNQINGQVELDTYNNRVALLYFDKFSVFCMTYHAMFEIDWTTLTCTN